MLYRGSQVPTLFRHLATLLLALTMLAPLPAAAQGDASAQAGASVTVTLDLPFDEAELAALSPSETVPYAVTVEAPDGVTISDATCEAPADATSEATCEAVVTDGVVSVIGEVPASEASPESAVRVTLDFTDTAAGIHRLTTCTEIGAGAAATPEAGGTCAGTEGEVAVRVSASPATEATPTEAAATPTAEATVGIAAASPTVEVVVPPTLEPTETPTPEPTATNTPEPTATNTPEPTETPHSRANGDEYARSPRNTTDSRADQHTDAGADEYS